MKLAKTYSYLKKDLHAIEEALHDAIEADHTILREASLQLLRAGGKRIRPIFVLLSARMGNFDIEKAKTVAVALELIHMATLVHDDVVDDSELRRGKPTIKKIYGNRVAMYTGDYLLARALEMITDMKDPIVHRLLAKSIVEVCVGEIEQIKDKYNLNQQLKNYLRRIKRKTALLIASSCQLGALAGGLSLKEANKLYKYGYHIGMSYQIIDDILDFIASPKVLGKPTGGDLLQGNITLPTLFAMQDETFYHELKETFADPNHISKEKLEQLITQIQQTDAIDLSYQVSDTYLKKALRAIEDFPNQRPKEILEDIARSIGHRRY